MSSWAPEEKWVEGIPMPDFTACFSISRDGAFFSLFLIVVFDFVCRHRPEGHRGCCRRSRWPCGQRGIQTTDGEAWGHSRELRVFSFFGINPPRRKAEVMVADAEEKKQQKAAGGAGTTIILEKKKQRGKATGASAAKHPKLLDSILGPDLLQSKGDSEEEHHEDSPRCQSLVAVTPIDARRAPALEYSAMAAESD